MVWSLALCPGDTKQDSGVYGAEFGVVFLAKGPRTASIQEGLDSLCLNHSESLSEEHLQFRVMSPGKSCPFEFDKICHVFLAQSACV